MKKLSIGILFVFISVVGVSKFAHASVQCRGHHGGYAPSGDYWPWGKEIDFPWRGIQGSWSATDQNGCTTFYTFHVLNQNKDKILKVEQYDGHTCQLLGRGLGYEKDRIVRARLTGVNGDFDLRIHVFKESDVIRNGHPTMGIKSVTVMSTSPAANPNYRTNYELTKVKGDPEVLCR